MRPRIIFVFVFLFFLILACGSSSRSTEVPAAERVITEIPTLTNTPVPTDTPTPQPSDTPTPLPAPTDTPTPQPSDTPTPLPAPTDTPTPQPSDTPTPLPVPTEPPVSEQENPVEEMKAVIASGENDINLRSGPGLDFSVVDTLPAGQTLEIIGRNADSSWWQVSTSNRAAWIAASAGTASNIDENIPIVDIPANQVTEPPPASDGSIIIVTVDKGEEFVDIQNVSNEAIDLSGWRLLSEKGGQNCNLGGVVQSNEILRIWAPADKADQGGFNCGFDGNIWNNSKMDPAVIFDSNGIEIYRVDCKRKVCHQ